MIRKGNDLNLLKKVKRQTRELASLYKMERLITSDLDLRHTLNLLTEMAIRLIDDSEICTLGFLSEDRKELTLASVARLGFKDLVNDKVLVEESALGEVVKTRRPYKLGELAKSNTYKFPRFVKERGLNSFLSVPLLMNGECIGALSVYSKSSDGFSQNDARLLSLFADQATISVEKARLFKRTKKNYLEMKKVLSQAVEERNGFGKGHSERVTKYAMAIARELGIEGKEMELLGEAGILHDMGKIAIDSDILNKPGKLTEEEWAEVKRHPVVASDILKGVDFLKELASIIRHHHERFEGGGYPDGLRDGKIPLESRILAVADSFEAMTSDRPYRKAFSEEEAIAELKKCSGTQFDPVVVGAFLKVIQEI